MKKTTGFLGTYFDKDDVLRLELWARIIGWATLAAYIFDAGYITVQNIYNAISGGFPPDWYFIITTLTKVLQGGVLFIILFVAAKMLLILMDIEDNTRRAARVNSKES